MTRRKTQEELAFTRTRNRIERIRTLIEQISYDWYDSDIHALSDGADHLAVPLLEFETDLKQQFAEYQRCQREEYR